MPICAEKWQWTCCTSREFYNLLEFYKIHHITSNPHFPQSNGFAEVLVGILKKLMEKSVKDGKLWNYGLLKYGVTPIAGNLPSPLEALTGWEPLFLRFHPVLESLWKVPKICKELMRRKPSTSSHYSMELEPGHPFLWKKYMEMYQKLVWLTNQQRNMNHIGLSFQTITYWGEWY